MIINNFIFKILKINIFIENKEGKDVLPGIEDVTPEVQTDELGKLDIH